MLEIRPIAIDQDKGPFLFPGLISSSHIEAKNFSEMRFFDDGDNYVGFEAPALSADQIWVLPSADGNAGEVLSTDSSGNLSWVSRAVGSAPVDAEYVVLSFSGTLTNARVLTETTNQVLITDDGAGSTVTLSTPQDIHSGASPEFAGMTLTAFSGAVIATAGVLSAGTLTVPLGGTGATTLTDHGILLGSGVGAITALGVATDGQIPIGSTGIDPVLATISGTANQVSVSNGAGSITLSTPQDIHAGASPTFANIGITTNATVGVCLDIGDQTNYSTPSILADNVVIANDAGGSTTGITIFSGRTVAGRIYFGDQDSIAAGRIIYDHNTNSMQIWTGGTQEFTIDSSGDVMVSGDLTANNLFVPDGGFVGISGADGWTFDSSNGDISTASKVGIKTTEPIEALDVNGNARLNGYLSMQGGFTAFNTTLTNSLIYNSQGGPFSDAGNLVLQSRPSLSRDIFFVVGGTPAIVMTIARTSLVGIGITIPLARLHVNGSADEVQLIVQAHSTQTANLVEFQDSSANVFISALGPTDGWDFTPGSDIDIDLLTVQVTGTPTRGWDESEDAFTQTHGQILTGGDLYFVGEDVGLVFGSMNIPGVDITVTIGDVNPTEVSHLATGDGWATGELNETTFPAAGSEHYVAVTKPGKYEILWNMSFHTDTGGAATVHGGVMIDGVAIRNNGEAHRKVSNTNDTGDMGAPCIADFPNGTEQVSLWLGNDQSNDLHVTHATVTIKLIGGT